MIFAAGLAACGVALILALVRAMRGPTPFDRLLAVNDTVRVEFMQEVDTDQIQSSLGLTPSNGSIYVEKRRHFTSLVRKEGLQKNMLQRLLQRTFFHEMIAILLHAFM